MMRSTRGRTTFRGSVKSRLGAIAGGPTGRGGKATIQSRLGNRGGGGARSTGRGGAMKKGMELYSAAAVANRPITDARQKININRVISGRVSDAREKIEIKRSKRIMTQLQQQLSPISNKKAAGLRSAIRGRGRVAGATGFSFSPVKTLKITTVANPSGSSGLFRSAVTGIGEAHDYYSQPLSTKTTSVDMLTRTIRNPTALSRNSTTKALTTASYGRITAGGGMFSSPSSAIAKVAPIANRHGMTMTMNSKSLQSRYHRNSDDEDEDMDIEDLAPLHTAPAPLRSSIKARLDAPSKYKVQVSNLQASVSTDDIVELFADVGDLVSARVIGGGQAEAYYRTKADCQKAIEAYHNRLLDGSPMKVVFLEEGGSVLIQPTRPTGVISGLKSAGGATMKIPKSTPKNNSVKIHPDISAIHKVLFQPSSSSNSTKLLFNKGN